MNTNLPSLPPPPIAGIERHLKWRALPIALFVAIIAALAMAGGTALVLRHRHPTGLPADAGVASAATALAGRITVATNTLRFRAAVLGGETVDHAPSAWMLAITGSARPTLEAASRRLPRDPRVLAALGALDLVAHDYPRAAVRYRHACELAPHYGEGRLGAGVALALEADRTAETWRSRALRLQAIAQFAMVDSGDVEYAAALYDRVRTLRETDRTREAAFYAARYRAVDDTSRWARALNP
jgi:hypothetical protein